MTTSLLIALIVAVLQTGVSVAALWQAWSIAPEPPWAGRFMTFAAGALLTAILARVLLAGPTP